MEEPLPKEMFKYFSILVKPALARLEHCKKASLPTVVTPLPKVIEDSC